MVFFVDIVFINLEVEGINHQSQAFLSVIYFSAWNLGACEELGCHARLLGSSCLLNQGYSSETVWDVVFLVHMTTADPLCSEAMLTVVFLPSPNVGADRSG